MTDNRVASLVHTPDYDPRVKTIPRKRPAKIDSVEEVESDNVPRKPNLVGHTSRQSVANNRPGRVTKVDERARYLLNTFGNKPNTRVIPSKKPTIDSFEQTESQNQPRKLILAARTSGRGDKRNRPGDASNLGIYRKRSEGELLRMFYDHIKKEEAISNSRNQ